MMLTDLYERSKQFNSRRPDYCYISSVEKLVASKRTNDDQFLSEGWGEVMGPRFPNQCRLEGIRYRMRFLRCVQIAICTVLVGDAQVRARSEPSERTNEERSGSVGVAVAT